MDSPYVSKNVIENATMNVNIENPESVAKITKPRAEIHHEVINLSGDFTAYADDKFLKDAEDCVPFDIEFVCKDNRSFCYRGYMQVCSTGYYAVLWTNKDACIDISVRNDHAIIVEVYEYGA